MKTKKKVLKASTKKIKDSRKIDFPGYPLYASADDIMNRSERVNANLENPKGSPQVERYVPSIDTEDEERQLRAIRPAKENIEGTEVTGVDLEALGTADLEMDGGDDELLKDRTIPVDFSGDDLDIPGSEDDEQQASVGSEDEESHGYSLGGDDHDDLEDDKPEVN